MEHAVGWFAKGFERGFEAFQHFYRRLLEWALHHRWFVFLTGNLALFAVIFFIIGSFVPAKLPHDAAPGTPFGLPGAIQAGLKLLPIMLAVGLIVTVVNFRPLKRFSFKYLLSALGFAMIFPFASAVGYQYAQWKGDSVFKFEFFPQSDGGLVQANVQLAPSANLADTQAVVERIEKVMLADPDVKSVVSNIGTQGVGVTSSTNQGSNYAQVQATLYDKESFTDRMPWARHQERLRQRKDTSVAAQITQAVGRIPGALVNISAVGSVNLGSAVQLSFTSDNRALLIKTAQAVRDGLAQGAIPGVINPDISSKVGKPELQVHPDRLSLADQGLTVADFAKAIQTLYQGNDDTKMRVNGREYPIRVMMDYADRNNPNILREVPVMYVQGNPVFIPSMARIDTEPGIDKITRRQRAEEIQVTADTLPGYANGTVTAAINTWLQQKKLIPPGVNYKPLGQADFQSREQGNLFLAFILGLILVYMLLASLYDNLLYPFIIQIAQPQAMVGALLALMLTNNSLNLVGFIGIIALVGLVGKNAILLVNYTNTLRDRGRTRHDALVEAAPIRLRPIMMTTMALILAMLPVALAIGRGSDFRATIGITIIGGISLSTLLTLLVIPCSYTIFDDISIALSKMRHVQPQHYLSGDQEDAGAAPEAEGQKDAVNPSAESSERRPQG